MVRTQLSLALNVQVHACAGAGTARISACALALRKAVHPSPKLPQAVRWPMVQRAGARCSALRVHTG